MTDSPRPRELETESAIDTMTTRERLANAAPSARSDRTAPIDLELVVVNYEDDPDRCTLTPRECSDEARLTTWLSANEAAFVDRREMR